MKNLKLFLIIFVVSSLTMLAQDITTDDLIIEGKKLIKQGDIQFDKSLMLKARGLFERALSMEPENEWAEYHLVYTDYKLAVYSMQKNEEEDLENYLEKSIDEAKELINKYPDNAEAKALLCSIYGIKISTNWELAPVIGPQSHSAIGEALEISPENPRVVLQAGVSKYNTPEFFGGSKEEGQDLFIKAIELFENDENENSVKPEWGLMDAYAWLGMSYANQKNYEKAVETYNKALEIEPKYGWIKYQLLPAAERKLANK